ncbi:MAG: hypothetical protein CL943_02600 [Candidatus Diapherotrites archaeon]|uniref:ABC transporter domain-containing protein n=1 Tax=Candidatus Iainarchaeum sp. TaxID=3101447 RepID=A0A2D6M165_9ARCH|nr:hypothetical protein [Candidatus Diapherotrites archaeon]
MIGTKDLAVSFGRNKIFQSIGLDIEPNGKYAVIGPNGSGKTTLALVLAGVIPEFTPADVKGEVQSAGCSLIMQNPSSQFFAMSVKEELGEKGVKLAKQFSASHLLERNVFELSEGEKQKINLIANLSFKNSCLMVDEPVELLDPVEAKRFCSAFSKVKDRTLIWFDKNEDFVAGMKKTYLAKPKKQTLPAKKNNVCKETVLSADFSLERNGFSVKEISFEVCAGEKIGLIGLNGSGKTCVLKALAGIEKQSGKLQANKNISYAPQNPSHLFFQETAEAELVDVGNARKLGIELLLQKNPALLSKGQQKMLSVATIAPNTVALLDEPTTWLDSANKASVYNFINNSEQAMILATHDRKLLDYCDRILIIKDKGVTECSSTVANRFFQA